MSGTILTTAEHEDALQNTIIKARTCAPVEPWPDNLRRHDQALRELVRELVECLEATSYGGPESDALIERAKAATS